MKYEWEDFCRLGNFDGEDCELDKVLNALPDLEKDATWLAGGALRRVLAGHKLDSDFDILLQGRHQGIELQDRDREEKARSCSRRQSSTRLTISKWTASRGASS